MKHWWQDAFFYHIYPLGFCGAEPENPAPGHGMGPGADASGGAGNPGAAGGNATAAATPARPAAPGEARLTASRGSQTPSAISRQPAATPSTSGRCSSRAGTAMTPPTTITPTAASGTMRPSLAWWSASTRPGCTSSSTASSITWAVTSGPSACSVKRVNSRPTATGFGVWISPG